MNFTLDQLLSNEDFRGLPAGEKQKILNDYPDFKGLSDKEQKRVITDIEKGSFSKLPGGKAAPKPASKGSDEPVGKFWQDNPNLYGMVGAAKGLGQAALETVGTVGGSLLGSATATPMVGGIAGAGAGFAGAKRLGEAVGLSDESPDMSMGGIAKDVATGAAFQVAGSVMPIVGRAAKWAGERIPGLKTLTALVADTPIGKGMAGKAKSIVAEKAAAPKTTFAEGLAGKELAGLVPEKGLFKTLYDANVEETKQLREKVAGYMPSLASETKSPAVIASQKSLRARSKTFQAAEAEREVANNQAINDVIESVKTGDAGVEDLIDTISSVRKGMQRDVQESKEALSAKVDASNAARKSAADVNRENAVKVLSDIGSSPDFPTLGEDLRTITLRKKNAMKEEAKVLYDAIPKDVKIEDASSLVKTLRQIVAENPEGMKSLHDAAEGTAKDVLKRLLLEKETTSSVLDAGGKPFFSSEKIPITSGEALSLSKYLNSVIARLQASDGPGEANLARKLISMQKGMDKLVDGSNNSVLKTAWREANDFYRTKFSPLFKQDMASRKVLAKDSGMGFRVADAEVGAQYFKPGQKGITAARNFKRVSQNLEPIQDYADRALYEVVERGGNPEAWLGQHKLALEEYGLLGRYKEFVDTLKLSSLTEKTLTEREIAALEEASIHRTQVDKLAVFEESAAGRLLNTHDVSQAVANVLTTKRGNLGKAIDELIGYMGKDEHAKAGLKNAVIDFVTAQWKSAGLDMAGNHRWNLRGLEAATNKYDVVLRKVLSPEELTTLKTARQAIRVMMRQEENIMRGSETHMFSADEARLSKAIQVGSYLAGKGWIGKVYTSGKNFMRGPVDDVLGRAFLDPAYARLLVEASKATKAGAPAGKVAKAFYAGLVAAGYGAYERYPDKQDEEYTFTNGELQ